MTATYTEDDRHHNYPINCKTRCLNSPITSDVTEDSQQFLSELLLKVNALYHADVSAAKQPDTTKVPTQYHVVHLEDQHDDSL
ncbi:signal peptide containing protein [Babesia ovata]|uniref:Signal peptide containing protein n=1 Tax=Babesia ovata TaxID=189622 RepID=A0A2H6KHA6_9APIC|nr:signal peptide containing protein [Babesia ovata]GBE62375.1 signal peptide containing protein [Babesia ovata]